MTTRIDIAADETLNVTWAGKKGRGSLFHVMAEGNAINANKLGIVELIAVFLAARFNPFPLGGGEACYRALLAGINAGKFADVIANGHKIGLGKLRASLVSECGSGCNAPHDSYLSIAADIKSGKTEIHSY